MTKERNIVYKAVQPGYNAGNFACPEIYKQGGIVRGENILTFPNRKAAIAYEALGYYGNAPFTGFVIEARPLGEAVTRRLSPEFSNLCVVAKTLKVLRIRAFKDDLALPRFHRDTVIPFNVDAEVLRELQRERGERQRDSRAFESLLF